MKLDKRYTTFVFALGMVAATSTTAAIVNTVRVHGVTPNFPLLWAQSFTCGFSFAFPVALLFTPHLRRFVTWLTRD